MSYKWDRCICLYDSISNGETIYKDVTYVYVSPKMSAQYFILYDERKMAKNILDGIYVHRVDFNKKFMLINHMDVDILFNDIMDGKVSM